MNRKKQTIIVVIIIILILLIVGIAGTLYFFMTNRKSNREIFINGLIQFMGQEETQANPLEAYLQKKHHMRIKEVSQLIHQKKMFQQLYFQEKLIIAVNNQNKI